MENKTRLDQHFFRSCKIIHQHGGKYLWHLDCKGDTSREQRPSSECTVITKFIDLSDMLSVSSVILVLQKAVHNALFKIQITGNALLPY